MPPKPQITAEAVYTAAFELARAEGIDAVSVRRVAEALGCSTQPVYTACGSMTQVRDAVVARACAVAEARLAGDGGEASFFVVGLGALRLAHEEPHLFRIAGSFMATRAEAPPPSVMAAMRNDPHLGHLPDAALARIHALLWVFSQGLAVMVQPGCAPDAMARARALLERAGQAVIAHELAAGPPARDAIDTHAHPATRTETE